MNWVIFAFFAAGLGAIGWGTARRGQRPWHELEKLVGDLTQGRVPKTFLIDGNKSAHRIGLALEDVFLRQRDLRSRAEEGELNIRTILSAMQDGLAVIDPNGRVRLLNAAGNKMFERSANDTGGTALETFGDTVIAKSIDETLRLRKAGSAVIKLRARAPRGERQVAMTALPLPEGEGAVVLFHDVTQLQMLEQVRRDFVSNVSHELRTPLSIFRGYLETLLDEPEISLEERTRILRVMEKHSERLQALVNDLLSLARLEAPEPQLQLAPIAAAEFLQSVAGDWERKAAAKNLSLRLQLEKELPSIIADRGRLEEVMDNLLENAVKFSRSGHEIVIRGRKEKEFLLVEVADEGAGIAGSDLPRIFERFYRADKARSRELGGTGLGLSIVKHIVHLHGGSVTAESNLGRGTTIRVQLPAAPGREAAALT